MNLAYIYYPREKFVLINNNIIIMVANALIS